VTAAALTPATPILRQGNRVLLRRGLPAAATVLAALLAGCTVGPSERPPVAVRGDHMPAPAQLPDPTPAPPPLLPEPDPQNPTIAFVDCTSDALAAAPEPIPAGRVLRADCGEIAVPIDPAQPALGRTLIGVLRVGRADAPADRPPLLVVGDSAGDPTALHALTRAAELPAEVLEAFTVVGVDRRGAGLDRLDCAPQSALAAVVDADPAGLSSDGLDALLEQARAVVQECSLALSGTLAGYRTAGTAADIEQVRVGLGVQRLSALGVGDGAAALAGWARAAPLAVGRLVLDGPPDPARDEPETAESRAAATEAALDAFATACPASPGGCPLGPDPRGAVTALVADLGTQPLAADDGRRLTAGGAVTALLFGLGEPRDWPALAVAVAAARAGDPDRLLAVLDPLLGGPRIFETALATACNDAQRRLSPPEVGELVGRWRAEFPLFGPTFAHRLLACAPWPATAPAPSPEPAAQTPPILVIGTAVNPRAPLEASRRAAESLAGGRLVSWQGAGTGAYPRTPCITEIVDALLLEGEEPRTGRLCPP
jgi:pimeloyl-ACP methyl ester carboxylesterase